MLRSTLLASLLIACHHPAATAVTDDRPCPAIEITRGTCAPPSPAPTECHGVCGMIVQSGSCTPVAHAFIHVNEVVAATDASGRFELSTLPAGHYRLVVSVGPETGAMELELTGAPEVLPQSLEVPRIENQGCGCGGPCPT